MNELNQRDQLTGLPERAHLWSKLSEIIRQIERNGTFCGVLLVKINQLNELAKHIGNDGIDQYLILLAERFKKSLWDMDAAFRFKDDQFVIVANSINRPEDIHVVMKKLQEYLAIECTIKKIKISPSTNIGIVLLPTDGTEIDEIMLNATSALSKSNPLGDNQYYYFNQELGCKIYEQESVKSAILATLADESFVLHLQPKINVESNKVSGVETLVRMRDSEGNIVSPNEFIPIAENSSLILQIGDWVLSKAHSLSLEWQQNGHQDLSISVNISDVQFKNGASLLSKLHKLAMANDGKASNLILEIGEDIILKDVELATALLNEIHQLGFQVSIDGFGSGSINLSVLKDLKIDEIKIDRQFLENVPSAEKDTSILKSMIMLGKSMNLRVVAMGVEQKEQIEILKNNHCDEFQGFYISKPILSSEFLKWLEEYSK